MKTCIICGETFENGKVYSNHIRWQHKKPNTANCKYCKKQFNSCGLKAHEKICSLNPNNKKYCLYCGHLIKNKNKKFCNRRCSGLFSAEKLKQTEKTSKCIYCGKTISSIINKKQRCQDCYKKRQNEYKRNRVFNCTCVVCGKSFTNKCFSRQTCSKTCCSKLLSNLAIACPQKGGETNYKKYFYKGVYMDSSWEVKVAEWLDKNNIIWKRTRKIMFWWTDSNGTKRRYYPDFFLPEYDIYIDPKNKFLLEQDNFKLKQVIKENDILLIYGLKNDVIKKLSQIIFDK